MSSTVEQLIPNPQMIANPFMLQVRGYGFEDGCVVTFDDVDQPTRFESDTLLTVDVTDPVFTPAAVVVQVRSPDASLSNTYGLNLVSSNSNQFWPNINDLAEFARVDADDVTLAWSLNAAITYGMTVLAMYTDPNTGGQNPWPTNDAVFHACLDYAGSLYTQRIGQADYYTSPTQGSTPQQRYRRALLASRYVAIA